MIENNACVNYKFSNDKFNHIQIFDILDEIKILIKKKNNFNLEIIEYVVIDFKIFNSVYKIEKHNIFFSDDNIVIIKFNLKKSTYYKNKNVGGIPIFILFEHYFERDFKINIVYKYNSKEYIDKYIEKIDFILGGYMILPRYIKNRYYYNKYLNLLPELMNRDDILSNLVFSNYNENAEFDNKMLNFLNILLYKKTICENDLFFDLYLEKETEYLLIKINKELNHYLHLEIWIDNRGIFLDNINVLSNNNGYYVYKFNSKLFCINNVLRLKFNSIEINGDELNDKYSFEFFNVYDYLDI
jgi:hypothetical protein